MKPHLLHPEAEIEYTAAAVYYTEIDPLLGARFFYEMERLIEEVRRHPQRFWMFDPPLSRHRSTAFPHSVVYLEKPEHIWIVGVMHGGRRPGYWRERLD